MPRPWPGPAFVVAHAGRSRPTTYTVRPGDSLFAIAQRFDTAWQHLAQVNHLPDPDLIHPGQRLTIG